tara:strand:+ start:850 stop:1716 length:867 start_codon:yes stop_codon:yes gene_type:complete
MLIVKPYGGRFGNKILQLLNVLNEAFIKKQQVNLDHLNYIVLVSPLIDLKNIENKFKELFPDDKNNITDTFFPRNLHLPNKRTVDIRRYFVMAKMFILPNLKVKLSPLDENICVIHIRSGDLFNINTPHSGYVQPPLNYYKKIINDFNYKFKKFYLICQPIKENLFGENYDRKYIGSKINPCIPELLKLPNVELIKGNLYEHYSLMLKAKSIIISRSSFSDTTIYLNKNLKNLFFWNWNHSFGDKTVLPKNINVYSYKLTKPYIDSWKCTNDQLKLMVDYDIKNISLE